MTTRIIELKSWLDLNLWNYCFLIYYYYHHFRESTASYGIYTFDGKKILTPNYIVAVFCKMAQKYNSPCISDILRSDRLNFFNFLLKS